MYTLTNDQLQVEMLDPLNDQTHFGTRYCTGGYIFQITDAHHGPLLTGPTYPESFNWFDGQGIPDAFNLQPLREPLAAEPLALIIGVGVCDMQHNQIRELCQWEITPTPTTLHLRTAQAYQGFALELERTVRLSARTVRSTTRLCNTGRRAIPVSWFPHPFFPQPVTPELCCCNIPVSMPDNPGYIVAESGFIARKAWPNQQGYYLALDHAAQSNLVILQRHPTLGLVVGTCSYIPSLFPIWGNQHTFSWEPFFERTLAVGQETTWWIDYTF
jgi:hypothetical protein